MSYELFINGRAKGQVASIGGMRALERELANAPEELSSFLLRGWSENPDDLKEEIEKIIANGKLSENSTGILQGILDRLPDTGIVSLSSE